MSIALEAAPITEEDRSLENDREATNPLARESKETVRSDAEKINVFLHELGLDDVAIRERAAEAGTYEKELIKRSGRNVRETLEAFLRVETEEGWLDVPALEKEITQQWKTITKPLVQHLMENLGVTADVDKLFTEPDRFEHAPNRGEILDRIRVAMGAKIDYSLPNQPRNRKWSDPMPDPMEHLVTLAEQAKIGPLSDQYQTDVNNALASLYGVTERQLQAKHQHRRTVDEILNEVRHERDAIEQANELTINIPADKLARMLDSGTYVGLFDLPENEKNQRASDLTFDREHYLRHRSATETMMRPTNPLIDREQAVVYGTLAAGTELDTGGAAQYGNLVIHLRPEVQQRVTFSEGDSLTPLGWSKSVREKMKYETADATNISRRQVHRRDAPLAKAMLNIDRRRKQQYGQEQLSTEYEYLEAHIFGGVRLEDIERVSVPEIFVRSAEQGYGNRALLEVIERLRADEKFRERFTITKKPSNNTNK